MLAPQPFLSACLDVLYAATIQARLLGYAGVSSVRHRLRRRNAQQITDLMDAVHNIPILLASWEKCDEALLRGTLKTYDDKWCGASSIRLHDKYQQALSRIP